MKGSFVRCHTRRCRGDSVKFWVRDDDSNSIGLCEQHKTQPKTLLLAIGANFISPYWNEITREEYLVHQVMKS
jgi:hypothetical protein